MDSQRVSVCLGLFLGIIVALPAGAATDDKVQRLERKLEILSQQYAVQALFITQMSSRLAELEGARTASTVYPPSRGRFIKTASQGQVAAQAAAEEVVREAKPSRSVENVLQEEHTLFGRKFTLETGLSYTHFDRSQLILNGFLALDAIFLGNLSLDEVETDILTLDVTGRWGVSDRLQVDVNAPFLYRHTNYQSGGFGRDASKLGEESVTLGPFEIGDVSAGFSYQLFSETADWPDVVFNLRAKAPTGTHPYGIDLVEVLDSGGGLVIPAELPSGNGVWSLSAGFSVLKTVDPAILFANIGYTHNFARKFDDILSDIGGTVVAGQIDLGNSLQYGLGVAFALNERLSLSTSYSQRFTSRTRTRAEGGSWGAIIGSDANAASLNIGATYALSNRASISANLGAGLTTDAPDYTFSLKFPYTF